MEPVLVNSPRRHGVTQIGSMKISKALAYGLPMLPSFISCVQVWGSNTLPRSVRSVEWWGQTWLCVGGGSGGGLDRGR